MNKLLRRRAQSKSNITSGFYIVLALDNKLRIGTTSRFIAMGSAVADLIFLNSNKKHLLRSSAR